MSENIYLDLSLLIGMTLISVSQDDDEILFVSSDYRIFRLMHDQSCCESVYIESIVGDLNDLIGSPILMAEECNSDLPQLEEWDYSFTWTFYKFATIKGYVDIRFYGTSNGYYSESVDFVEVVV